MLSKSHRRDVNSRRITNSLAFFCNDEMFEIEMRNCVRSNINERLDFISRKIISILFFARNNNKRDN